MTDEDDELTSVPKLDYQQSFMVTFGICIWVCENTALSEEDKKTLIGLSFTLLNAIMPLSNAQGIRDMLKDQTHFLTCNIY